MTTHLKRLLRHTPIVLAMAFLLGSSRPAHAGCMIAFADCAVRAAAETSYWRSVFATADCELELADCVRRALIGR
ncbi:MAG: hypothetical protein DMF95_27695 [Acidobacteria bacterium]|nr:MAG: hypothetical protein DMF96_03115 [Acidobacteriota bacterium]PYR16733.1 MAG: hypothetical protein DMF94_26875 [Acidobacteriota bacterium]PYR42708.1 MAG: hypothetical protein DMF95_27695 [Acidobacteriota bacterium]